MISNVLPQWTLLLLILPGLSACGFHLRGEVELPDILLDTYIQSENPYTGMAAALRVVLESAGAHVVASPEQAGAILEIIRERSENRVLSVGSQGKASEYELFDEITYTVADPSGKRLLKPQNLRTTRDLVFDQNELLGKISEAEGIHRQMRSDLARQVIRRISATVPQP